MNSVLIGIAGGTGSGKTTIAEAVVEAMGEECALVIPQDAYYRDRSPLSVADREKVNYDHPSAFDEPLLIAHLRQLKSGRPIPRLSYDYATHVRVDTGEIVQPKSILVLEGIMALHNRALRALMELKVFVEADPDVRFIRRLKRDLIERSATVESVIAQYLTFVRPMHKAFVEPSRQYADLVVSGEDDLQASVDRILRTLSVRSKIADRRK